MRSGVVGTAPGSRDCWLILQTPPQPFSDSGFKQLSFWRLFCPLRLSRVLPEGRTLVSCVCSLAPQVGDSCRAVVWRGPLPQHVTVEAVRVPNPNIPSFLHQDAAWGGQVWALGPRLAPAAPRDSVSPSAVVSGFVCVVSPGMGEPSWSGPQLLCVL